MMDHMGVVYAKNKTQDMTNRIGAAMLEDKMKEHNGLYMCRLHQNKTRDMMDHIGVIYVGKQNKKTQWIVWVPSTSKQNKRHDGSYRCRLCSKTK